MKYDRTSSTKCIKARPFDLAAYGWKEFNFAAGTNDQKDASGAYKDNLKIHQTRQTKCSGPSARWRLSRIRGHPSFPIKIAKTFDVHFSAENPADMVKEPPSSPLTPLGGKCGMTITRSGNKDITRWARCDSKEKSTVFRCTDAYSTSLEHASGKCSSSTDMNPSTFTRFKAGLGSILRWSTPVIATSRIWLYKHTMHHEHVTLKSFTFACGDKGSQSSWTQMIDLDEYNEWTSAKHGWVGIWLCKQCESSIQMIERIHNNASHKHLEKHLAEIYKQKVDYGYVYLSEVLFAPASVRKASLPAPLNMKIQNEWCVRKQSVVFPFKETDGHWPGLWPIKERHGGSLQANMVRSVGKFNLDIESIPCGSTIAASFMFYGAQTPNPLEKQWCKMHIDVFVKDACGNDLFKNKAKLELRKRDLRARGPSKFFGIPTSAVQNPQMDFVAYGSTLNKHCHNYAAAQRGNPVIEVQNRLEIIFWYKPMDIDTPCA